MSKTPIRSSTRARRVVAGGAAALALAGLAAGCGSSRTATAASTTQPAAPAAAGTAPTRSGTRPPGFGAPVTGPAAAKAKAAALARYPGTVEHVMKLADGSYVVHVIRSTGSEVHVKVSKAFAVTGLEQGPPGGGPPSSGGAPPSGGSAPPSGGSAPPSGGSAPSSGSSSST